MKKKNHTFAWFLCIIVLIVAGYMVFKVMSDGDEPTYENNAVKETENDLTPEQKAEKLKNDAETLFSDGKYKDAILICNTLSEDYEDTDAAKDIISFVEEKIGQNEKIEAKELFYIYKDNIVNADKNYTDTVLCVTGKVGSIGKTNNEKNFAILLKCDTPDGCVQLNFGKDFEDEIAAISVDDTITIVGKCSGTSGKHLLSSGSNVMIEECCFFN